MAEEQIRLRRFGRAQRLRVDLHGIATFGPGDEHTAIRWEWIEDLDDGEGKGKAVVVRSAKGTITIPAGTFGLATDALIERLEQARSISRRTEVIAELAQSHPPT
ncbi:hypothetical protein BH20ACT1_BH20ACT1_05340 [soil metagenome]|jgi:hypothetical protein